MFKRGKEDLRKIKLDRQLVICKEYVRVILFRGSSRVLTKGCININSNSITNRIACNKNASLDTR